MTKTTSKQIKNAYESFKRSSAYSLHDVYGSYSQAKENAYNYCRNLCRQYDGTSFAIIGANTMTFSAGFIGTVDGEECFVYITKSYDRYIPLSLI